MKFRGSWIRKHLDYFGKAFKALIDGNGTMHSAALAYYAVFSIAPIVIISVVLAGMFFGEQASRGEVFSTIRTMIGDSGAHAVQGLVLNASRNRSSGRVATVFGIVTLVFGASGAFQQMEQSLNLIWRVETQPGRGLWNFVRQRLLSFSLVLVIGFLLLISLVISATLAMLGTFIGNRLPGGETLWHGINFLVSFGFITVLFAAIFKILPDVRLKWPDVWMGGAVTAFLFNVGKFAIGLYLGKSSITSSYGAAGSLVMILLWAYYSALILYLGAEYTRAYATRDGQRVEPRLGARYATQSAA